MSNVIPPINHLAATQSPAQPTDASERTLILTVLNQQRGESFGQIADALLATGFTLASDSLVEQKASEYHEDECAYKFERDAAIQIKEGLSDRLAVVEAELAAARATIDEARSILEKEPSYNTEQNIEQARDILAAHPTAALAEHDARVLEEVLPLVGNGGARYSIRQRIAEYRAQGDGTSHDEQTGADRG